MPGTESVASIVAFGAAAKLAREELDQRREHTERLRDRFETLVSERVPDIVFNGDREHRLDHISNISFRFIEGEGLLISSGFAGHRCVDGLGMFLGDTRTVAGDSRFGT